MCFWYMCILLYICICYPYIWTFVWIFLFGAILYWSCGHCACLYVKDTRKIFLIYNILGYIVLGIRDNIYAWLYIESFTVFLYMWVGGHTALLERLSGGMLCAALLSMYQNRYGFYWDFMLYQRICVLLWYIWWRNIYENTYGKIDGCTGGY